MDRTNPRNRQDFLMLTGLAFALILGGIYLTRAYVMDDALITLRYSFNLARHGHAIWNQADTADPSLGYTTVLWMLLNAVPAFFTQNKDLLVLACKLIALIPLVAIVFLLVGRIDGMPVSRTFRLAVVAVIFSQVVYGFHVNSGMETLLYSCLILLTVYSYAQDAPGLLPYLFGILAFLTRPEGAIMVALLLLWDLRRRRLRELAMGGACFAAAAAVLGLVLHAAYGTVLPNAFYVKQGYASLASLKVTLKFLGLIALPFLGMAAYSVYGLKNSMSRYCWNAAVVYTGYYLTVTPLMNVYSRYQWPILVLLTFASLPAFQRMGEAMREPASRVPQRRLAFGALLLGAVLMNLRTGRSAVRLARSSGSEEHALIELGKAMAPEREADRWMAYVDAGAVCYYSDWNAYDTMGLNTRQIAQRSVDPWQVYGYPHTDLVLLNVGDYTDTIRPPAAHEMAGRLRRLGYQYAGRVPIGADGAKQHWDVLLFARDLPRAQSLLRSVRVAGLTESRKRIWYSESLALPGPHPTTHFVGTRPLRGYPALPRTAGRGGAGAGLLSKT